MGCPAVGLKTKGKNPKGRIVRMEPDSSNVDQVNASNLAKARRVDRFTHPLDCGAKQAARAAGQKQPILPLYDLTQRLKRMTLVDIVYRREGRFPAGRNRQASDFTERFELKAPNVAAHSPMVDPA